MTLAPICSPQCKVLALEAQIMSQKFSGVPATCVRDALANYEKTSPICMTSTSHSCDILFGDALGQGSLEESEKSPMMVKLYALRMDPWMF